MKKLYKFFITGVILLGLFSQTTFAALNQSVGGQQYIKKTGTISLVGTQTTYEWGSTLQRWAKVWMIDADISGVLTFGGTLLGDMTITNATPSVIFRDTDATDGDDNATIDVNCTDVGSGTEDCDVTFTQQVAGTPTNWFVADADGNITFTTGGNIVLDDVTLTGGTNTFNLANGTASLDIAAASVLDVNANLTVESASFVNQDLTTDASVAFTGLSNTDANITSVGDIALDSLSSAGTNISIGATNSSDILQIGDGTYSWTHAPMVGIEGVFEVDGAAYFDGGITTGDTTISSAQPTLSYDDTDAADHADNTTIYSNCTDTGTDTEDCDVVMSQYLAGILTEFLNVDADGSLTLAQTGQAVEIIGGNLTLGSATADTGIVTLIKGAQIGDPQTTLSMSADGVGDFSVTTASGSDGDIHLLPSGNTVEFGTSSAVASAIFNDAGTLTMMDDGNDTNVVIGPVQDGTTTLGVTGSLDVSAGLRTGGDLFIVDGSGNTSLVSGTFQMGSATVDANTFSMIDGAQTGDDTFTITTSGDGNGNVALATTDGGIDLNPNDNGVDFFTGLTTDGLSIQYGADDGVRFGVNNTNNEANNNFIFTSVGNSDSPHGHTALSSEPSLFIHSNLDVNTDNGEFLGFSYLGLQGGTMETDRAKFDMTLQSVAPFATATGTNRDGADIILQASSPTNSGTVYGVTSIGVNTNSHSIDNTADSLFVDGRLEVDGAVFIDGLATLESGIQWGAGSSVTAAKYDIRRNLAAQLVFNSPDGTSQIHSINGVTKTTITSSILSLASGVDLSVTGGRIYGGGVQLNAQTLAADTNLTLDENDALVSITLGSTSDNIIDLPACSGNEGAIFHFYITDGTGTNNAVVTRAGSDTIANGSADTGNTTVTLGDTADYVELRCVNSSTWTILHESGTTVD